MVHCICHLFIFYYWIKTDKIKSHMMIQGFDGGTPQENKVDLWHQS